MRSLSIRRQVYELTADELELYPVWELALDEEGVEGQDEATVRPLAVGGAPDPNDGGLIVRARFVLADGTPMCGYLTTPHQGDSGLGALQPVVLGTGGQVPLWCGSLAPDAAEVARSYPRLGKSKPADVFPLTFRSDVELVSGPLVGSVPGFLVLEDFETMRTRVVR